MLRCLAVGIHLVLYTCALAVRAALFARHSDAAYPAGVSGARP
jgi:hypothetical protein